MDSMDWFFDVKNAELGFDPNDIFHGWLEVFCKFKEAMTTIHDDTVFNQHGFYRKAVNDALDLKEGTIQKVCARRLLKSLTETMVPVDNRVSFKNLILRLEGTHASRFEHQGLRTQSFLCATSMSRADPS